jgi:hypothetical protein
LRIAAPASRNTTSCDYGSRLKAGTTKVCEPGRHCERSEAIQLSAQKKEAGLLRRFAPRNDGQKHVRPRGADAPEALQNLAPK